MIKKENHGEIAIVTFSDEFHTPNRRNDSFSTPEQTLTLEPGAC